MPDHAGMAIRMLRPLLVAVIGLVLLVTGLGQRPLIHQDTLAGIEVVPGVATPICHDGSGAKLGGNGEGTAGGHACCDACALLAPAILPASPGLAGPFAVAAFATHAGAVAWAPSLARLRGPKLSQGPPTA